jgi:hypothetical protein
MGFAAQVRARSDSDCPVSISSLGSKSVRLKDGARVGQIRAAIYEQRTPMQRAWSSVSRALTDEGLMSQEYFEEAEAGASLIAVLAPEPRLVTDAQQILAAHGARHMRFYDHNASPTSREKAEDRPDTAPGD